MLQLMVYMDVYILWNIFDNRKSGNNFLDNSGLNDFINSINNFLSSLSHEQLGAVLHISGSIAILYCVISIISIIFGDRLIIYFKLEEKYPKLAKFIKIRRKFLDYNLMLNIIIIIIVLLVIIYINFLVLVS